MHINFGGPLNNLQVKNHDLAMYVVSIWTTTMNKTESTQPAIFPIVLLKLAPFHGIVLTLCLQPASPAQLLSQVTARETFPQIRVFYDLETTFITESSILQN